MQLQDKRQLYFTFKTDNGRRDLYCLSHLRQANDSLNHANCYVNKNKFHGNVNIVSYPSSSSLPKNNTSMSNYCSQITRSSKGEFSVPWSPLLCQLSLDIRTSTDTSDCITLYSNPISFIGATLDPLCPLFSTNMDPPLVLMVPRPLKIHPQMSQQLRGIVIP